MRNMESRYSLRSATMIDPQSSWMAQRFHAWEQFILCMCKTANPIVTLSETTNKTCSL
jgi:hypothetical protein